MTFGLLVGTCINEGLDAVDPSVGNVVTIVDGIVVEVGTHVIVGEEELILGTFAADFTGKGLLVRSSRGTVGSQADGSRAHTSETVAVGTCDGREARNSFVVVGASVSASLTAGSPIDRRVNAGTGLDEGIDKAIGSDVVVWHSSGINIQTKGRPSFTLDGTNEFQDRVGLDDNRLGCSHALGTNAHTSDSVGSWEITDGTSEGMRVWNNDVGGILLVDEISFVGAFDGIFVLGAVSG